MKNNISLHSSDSGKQCDVEDCFYDSNEYSKLSTEQKNGMSLKPIKWGHFGKGGRDGSGIPAKNGCGGSSSLDKLHRTIAALRATFDASDAPLMMDKKIRLLPTTLLSV
jgi:hypothetical protein